MLFHHTYNVHIYTYIHTQAKVLSLQSANGKRSGVYGVSGAENTRVSLQLEDYEIIGALKDTLHGKLAENYLTGTRF